MSLNIIETQLSGVLIIQPQMYEDSRGFFMETYHHKKYTEDNVGRAFVQDNYSHSRRGVLRGLHYQLCSPQGKLVFVVQGAIFDVAVDIRRGSPTFGKWVGTTISAENRYQIYVPEGFAHGFCVLSEDADVIYKCTDFYVPNDEYGILWSDPSIGIDWPFDKLILSEKDSHYPKLSGVAKNLLPKYV